MLVDSGSANLGGSRFVSACRSNCLRWQRRGFCDVSKQSESAQTFVGDCHENAHSVVSIVSPGLV